jgi:hypothetical protein
MKRSRLFRLRLRITPKIGWHMRQRSRTLTGWASAAAIFSFPLAAWRARWWGLNAANAAVGKRGGFFNLEPEAALEPQLAQARVGGKGPRLFNARHC